MENEKKFLPIGTVVNLNCSPKKLMIINYLSNVMQGEKASNEIFDYVGCLFPEGNFFGSEVALFNHDDIAKIWHLGLIDDDQKEFNSKLEKLEFLSHLKENIPENLKVDNLQAKE